MLDLGTTHILIFVAIGTTIGFINTLAGGGMLIAMPILLSLGLPTHVANATLRLSILLQTVGSVFSFYSIGYYRSILPIKTILPNLLPLVCGAMVGSFYSTQIDPEHFKLIIAAVMILLAIASIFRTEKRITSPKTDPHIQLNDYVHTGHPPASPKPSSSYVFLLLIGLYAGLIQGGVGFVLILFCMSQLKLDAVSANAFKVISVLCYSLFCLPIFLRSGLVRVDIAIIIGLSTFIGSWTSVRLQTRLPAIVLRRLILAIIAISGCIMLCRTLR